jgi:hypothetical protein
VYDGRRKKTENVFLILSSQHRTEKSDVNLVFLLFDSLLNAPPFFNFSTQSECKAKTAIPHIHLKFVTNILREHGMRVYM